MKDKISAATEQEKELSENLKLRSDGSSEKARGNAGDNVDPDNSSVPGAEKIEGAGSTSSQESSTTNETLFSKFGKGISNASSSAAAVLKSLKETKIMDVTKKGYDIVKEGLTSTPSRRRRMQNAASASAYKERNSATSVVPVAVKQTHWGKKWEEFKEKILHISDVEVKETKLMGNVPIIIVSFQTQQIYCVRDRSGKGGEVIHCDDCSIKIYDADALLSQDDIHTVYYAWAMQQMDVEEMGEGELYPMWKLREMQQLGVQSLI